MVANRTREPAKKLKPIIDPAAWDAAEMERDESWVYRFSDREIDEILAAARALVANGIDLVHVGKENFVLPKTAASFADIYDELKNGRGFVQMRGLPVDEISREETAAVLWGVGTHFGKALSQNPEGHVLGHVKDLGKDYDDPMVRGYQTKAAMTFHADPCDMVALLCVNTAKSDGESRVASSVTLYNEMLKRRPDLVADLCEDFFWTKHGEFSPGEDPWYKLPVFAFLEGRFSAKGASTHARKAQDLPGAERWSALRNEAVALFQELVPDLAADLPFQQGDLQILNSHVTLHSRRPYEDWEEANRKRHLYRLWIENEDLRPLPDAVRQNLKGVEVDGYVPRAPLDAEEAA
jgi:hypothetical protein